MTYAYELNGLDFANVIYPNGGESNVTITDNNNGKKIEKKTSDGYVSMYIPITTKQLDVNADMRMTNTNSYIGLCNTLNSDASGKY